MSTATLDAWTALGDPTRRRIFAEVAARPRSVTALAAGLPVSRPAVSQHLRVLGEAALVSREVRGREHVYSARLQGLDALRRELDSFWGTALANFLDLVEQDAATEESR